MKQSLIRTTSILAALSMFPISPTLAQPSRFPYGTISSGQSANIGGQTGAQLQSNYGLENSGSVLNAWNYTGGGGETDFIENRGPGTPGGFNFYDLSNNGVVTKLLGVDSSGNVTANSLTLGATPLARRYGFDPRDYGASCGTADATAGIQAAVNAAAVTGGEVEIACPYTVAGEVYLYGGVRLHGRGPVYYPGQADTAGGTAPGQASNAGANVWPPATGPAINCTSTSAAACLSVEGSGVEVDHINFGNPQGNPSNSGWTVTTFPWVISTDPSVSWQGLNIHDVSFTSITNGINLNSTSNYNNVYAGSQIKVDHIWFNALLGTSSTPGIGIGFYQIDNPLRVSNVEFTPAWYFNVSATGAAERTSIGFDVKYLAAPLFSDIGFFAQGQAIRLQNGKETNNFGNLTLAMTAGKMSNMFFDQVCQAITMPGGNGTQSDFSITNFEMWGDQSGFACSKGKALVDVESNNANVTIADGYINQVDTFLNAGAGASAGGGAAHVHLDDIQAYTYSAYSSGQPFIKLPSNGVLTLGSTLKSDIYPASGAGPLIGPGSDGTQGYEACNGVGGAGKDGSAVLCSGGDNVHSGYDAFYQPSGSRVGYVGYGSTSVGIGVAADRGAIFLQPDHLNSSAPSMSVGVDGNNKLQINVNNLPTSCTNEPTGTLYDSNHQILSC